VGFFRRFAVGVYVTLSKTQKEKKGRDA